MSSPFQAPDTGADPGQSAFASQGDFQKLPTQEQAPQTYQDPSWEPPPQADVEAGESEAEPVEQPAARPQDYNPSAPGVTDIGATGEAVARRMHEAGYSPDHIAGVLGVLQQESGLDTGARGDGGTSLGIAQWHNSRATALMQFARDRNLDPYDADTQAQYMVSELNGGAHQAGQDLMAQQNFAGAARVWRSEFEKSGKMVNGQFIPSGAYDNAAIAAASRYLPSVRAYVQSLTSGQADKDDAQDGTINGTQDGSGGASGQDTTLDPVSRMKTLIGGNAATAAPFIKAGGGNLDPRKDNWCAAFVNAALGQSGVRGSNSNVATSFMGWGQGVDANQVQANDVVVVPRGHSQGETGGHVGLATGGFREGPNGPEVEVISGNTQHGHVALGWYDANSVLIRRSGTANTQGQDPDGAGPDVQPTQRFSNMGAMRQSGNLNLPDLDAGAPVPHGDGSPMDPADAATYRQTFAPEGWGEFASQFGGTLSDMAGGIAKDVMGGNGPIGGFVDSASDWLTKKTGVDFSWMHSAPGQAAPFQGALNTTDKITGAVNRAIGYDPNAPTSGWGDWGRNTALVALMGLGGTAGAVRGAEGLGAKALALGQGAERSIAGGATLTEAPEIIKDATGSQTAGTVSQLALAAALGLRVPLAEKLVPTISKLATGFGNAAKKFTGEGIDGATALANLTPSQLAEASRSALTDGFRDLDGRVTNELGALGTPSAWADAGTTDANLVKGTGLYREAIANQVDAARAFGRSLYNNPVLEDAKTSLMRDYSGANDAVANELSKFQADKANFGRPDTDYPSDILDRVFKDQSPARQVSTGILGPDGKPIMRTVSGTGKKGLGIINNLGSGIEARSQLEEEIRNLLSTPAAPGVKSQVGILQRVSNALNKDINDLSNGEPATQEAVQALRTANAYHSSLQEILQRPEVSALLDKGIANGREAVDPLVAASRFFQSGPAGASKYQTVNDLAKLTGNDPNNLKGFYADVAKQNFMKAAAPDGQNLDPMAGARFLQKYGPALDQIPEVKTAIQSAVDGEQSVSQFLGNSVRGWRSNPQGAYDRRLAADNWLDAPTQQTLAHLDGRPPVEQKAMMGNVLQQLARDKTGAAFRGFRQHVVDNALGTADADGSAGSIVKWAGRNQGVIRALSDGPDPTFGERVDALSNVGSRAGRFAIARDLAERILGVHVGGMVNRLTGGEGAGPSLMQAGWGVRFVKQMSKLATGDKLNFAKRLLESPEAFENFDKMGGGGGLVRGALTDAAGQFRSGELLSSYLQGGATPAAFVLSHMLDEERQRQQQAAPVAPTQGSMP